MWLALAGENCTKREIQYAQQQQHKQQEWYSNWRWYWDKVIALAIAKWNWKDVECPQYVQRIIVIAALVVVTIGAQIWRMDLKLLAALQPNTQATVLILFELWIGFHFNKVPSKRPRILPYCRWWWIKLQMKNLQPGLIFFSGLNSNATSSGHWSCWCPKQRA